MAYEEQIEAGQAISAANRPRIQTTKFKKGAGANKELGLENRRKQAEIQEAIKREALERDFMKGLDFQNDIELKLYFQEDLEWYEWIELLFDLFLDKLTPLKQEITIIKGTQIKSI
mmetsp:Transcript_24916/g.38720  ORF Transcript_24916/g.38720 Transcript_24916/m.38720 type:complete len:116 (+) Transcript_24916:445-792(+)